MIQIFKMLSSLLTVALSATFCLGFVAITGCGSDENDTIAGPTESALVQTVGEMKRPEAAPGAPQLKQVPKGTPTVTSVGYYSDWKLTKELTGTVPAGKTIFIKVKFSEGMKLVVADDKTARPILYHRIAGKLTRFRIATFGAKGENFVSGDAKPVKTQATFVGKYTVQPKDKGAFVFAVGKFSVDRQGNTLPAFYTHKEKLHLGETLLSPGTPILATARDSGTHGDNITNHTTVILVGKFAKAPPKGTIVQLYNNDVVIPNAVDSEFFNGVRWAVSLTLPEGTHILTAKSIKGDQESEASKPLTLTIDITAPKAETEVHLDGNTLDIEVSGKDVVHYRYAVVEGKCDAETVFSDLWSVKTAVVEDVTVFPAGTLSICVVGIDIAGNRQAAPTVVTVEKTTPAAPTPQVEPTTPAAQQPTPKPGRTPAVTIPQGANATEAARKAELVMLWVAHKRRLLAGNQATFLSRWDSEVSAPLGISRGLAKEIFIIQLNGPNGVPAAALGSKRWFPETIREYAFLRFLYPTKGEREILNLFRQSVQAGKTAITLTFRLPHTTELKEAENLLPL